MNSSRPLVSVITVVYNGSQVLEGTILSVLNQSWPSIEIIIIDGGSTDGTQDIILRYANRLAWWVSEPDAGLYDAMNKGLAAARGDYVWFINAGDRIYTSDTLERALSATEPGAELPAVIYGDTMIVNDRYEEIGLRRLRPPRQLTWRSFRKGMLVCHQAILVRRDLAEPYDLRYRHSADFDWVIRALKRAEGRGQKAKGVAEGRDQKAEGRGQRAKGQRAKGGRVHNSDMVLCAFLDGGHSKQNIKPGLRERFNSMVTHYGLASTLLWHLIIPFRFIAYVLRHGRF